MSGSVWDEGDYLCCRGKSLSHIPISLSGRYFPLKAARPRWTASRHTNTHTHYTLGTAHMTFQIKNVDSKYNALHQKMHITDRTDLFYLLHEAIQYCI